MISSRKLILCKETLLAMEELSSVQGGNHPSKTCPLSLEGACTIVVTSLCTTRDADLL
jgi:hypothetical protein